MKPVQVKNLMIGEGMAKVCVPLVGKNQQEIESEIELLLASEADLVEWRVDFLEEWENSETVIRIATLLSDKLKNYPILFTFRTANEGGNQAPSVDYYQEIYTKVIEAELVDMIDIELAILEKLSPLVELATKKNIKIVLSYHNFEETPKEEDLLNKLRTMAESCGDICKIAVMPKSLDDVIELLKVTKDGVEITQGKPVVTISMGSLGKVTRVGGTVFGSALTFGSLSNNSAPGQIEGNKLKELMNYLY